MQGGQLTAINQYTTQGWNNLILAASCSLHATKTGDTVSDNLIINQATMGLTVDSVGHDFLYANQKSGKTLEVTTCMRALASGKFCQLKKSLLLAEICLKTKTPLKSTGKFEGAQTRKANLLFSAWIEHFSKCNTHSFFPTPPISVGIHQWLKHVNSHVQQSGNCEPCKVLCQITVIHQ